MLNILKQKYTKMVKGRISLVLQFLIAENVFFVVAIFTKIKNDCHKLKKIWNSRWNKILILKKSVQKKLLFYALFERLSS